MGEAVPTTFQDSVKEDLLCARCTYNLRTIVTDGNCPECAMPVAQSLAAGVSARRDYGRIAIGAGCVVIFFASQLMNHLIQASHLVWNNVYISLTLQIVWQVFLLLGAIVLSATNIPRERQWGGWLSIAAAGTFLAVLLVEIILEMIYNAGGPGAGNTYPAFLRLVFRFFSTASSIFLLLATVVFMVRLIRGKRSRFWAGVGTGAAVMPCLFWFVAAQIAITLVLLGIKNNVANRLLSEYGMPWWGLAVAMMVIVWTTVAGYAWRQWRLRATSGF